MHELFADWCHQVDLNPTEETLNARWRCVEAAVAILDKDTVLQLTRACFGVPCPQGRPGKDGEAIVQVFKQTDITFRMKDNGQLLRVLFGATLAQAIQTAHSKATFAALAVACARCSGLVEPPPIEELPSFAETHLSAEGRTRRESALAWAAAPPEPALEIVAPVLPDVQDVPASQWGPIVQNFQNLKTWSAQVNASIGALIAASRAREASPAFSESADRRALEHRIDVLKEETDVLWWLFGGQSATVGKPWDAGKAAEFCMPLGRELADMMAFHAPPANAESFLSRAISRCANPDDALTIAELLEAGAGAWQEPLAHRVRASVGQTGGVTPLHAALVARVDARSAWEAHLREATSLKPDDRLLPVQWALQAYRETLVFDSLGRANG